MKKDVTEAISCTAKILDLWLPYKIRYDYIPGLSVGIVHKGKLVYKAGFGFADLTSKRNATPETCYRIASISKTFTSVAILQLVENRQLCLDDCVEKHLSWFKARNKSHDSRNITIKQILSHTGGIFRDGITAHWITGEFPDSWQLKKSITNKSIIFENLTRFKYSNSGYALLGEVIKKVSGVSYEEYVTRYIIQKLNLKHTTPDFISDKINLAVGYAKPVLNEELKSFDHVKTNAYAPAAGFISNVPDLAKFISALSLKRNDERTLLNRESKKEMMRGHWQTSNDTFYGLGAGIRKIDGRKIIGHAGGFIGFESRIFLDVENDIGIIVLCNVTDSSTDTISQGILETIYNFVDNKASYSNEKERAKHKKHEGVYRNILGEQIVVDVNGQLISFGSRGSSPLKDAASLKSSGNDRFIIETKCDFDSPGEIAKFIFNGNKKQAGKLIWGSMPFERIND